jgi:hypothetical protein
MSASPGLAVGQQLFEGLETDRDPVPVPGVVRGLVESERLQEIAQHAQIVDRMDVARDRVGNRAHARAARRIGGQERRLGMHLVEIFADRQRLRQHDRAVFERGHEAKRVPGEIVGRPLLVAAQMHEGMLGRQTLQGKRDAHAERRRRTEIAPEFHACGPL